MCLIIQQYASDEIFNLSGCINDANSIVGFLSRRLHVTDSNIICLTNASATRNAIISKFQDHLLYNEDILYGDTIIFFYAGHGSRVTAPADWISADNKVETLCPYDERLDSQDGYIHGIPDYTINKLLRELADAKGDNIVRGCVIVFTLSDDDFIIRRLSSTPAILVASHGRPRAPSRRLPVSLRHTVQFLRTLTVPSAYGHRRLNLPSKLSSPLGSCTNICPRMSSSPPAVRNNMRMRLSPSRDNLVASLRVILSSFSIELTWTGARILICLTSCLSRSIRILSVKGRTRNATFSMRRWAAVTPWLSG
jgi:hypothetical protein